MHKVIIADDERLIREGIAAYIARSGLELEVVGLAADGNQALDIYRQIPADILIADIRMPGMDGFELVETLIEMGARPKVVLISSYDDFTYAQHAIRLGIVSEYVLKPIDREKLASLLGRIISELKLADGTLASAVVPLSAYKELMAALHEGGYDRLRMVSLIRNGEADKALREWGSIRDTAMRVQPRLNVFKRFCISLIMPIATSSLELRGVADMLEDPLEPILKAGTLTDALNATADYLAKIGECHKVEQSRYSRLIQRAMEIIATNYQKPDFNLTSLSASLSVSPGYLSTQFKKETSVGFMNYLTDKRIHEAKLLLQGNYKVYEVAQMVGYEDERYFLRLFKKHTGMTPKEFSRKHPRDI